jgi:hypothetical protein
MYTVIGTVKSRALRVLWMLEELGEPLRAHPRRTALRGRPPPQPLGQDPGASRRRPGDHRFGRDHDLPRRPPRRADLPRGHDRARPAGRLHQLINDEFDAVLWMAGRHSFVLPEEMRLPAIKESLKLGIRTQSQSRLWGDPGRRPVPDGRDDDDPRHPPRPLHALGRERELPGDRRPHHRPPRPGVCSPAPPSHARRRAERGIAARLRCRCPQVPSARGMTKPPRQGGGRPPPPDHDEEEHDELVR